LILGVALFGTLVGTLRDHPSWAIYAVVLFTLIIAGWLINGRRRYIRLEKQRIARAEAFKKQQEERGRKIDETNKRQQEERQQRIEEGNKRLEEYSLRQLEDRRKREEDRRQKIEKEKQRREKQRRRQRAKERRLEAERKQQEEKEKKRREEERRRQLEEQRKRLLRVLYALLQAKPQLDEERRRREEERRLEIETEKRKRAARRKEWEEQEKRRLREQIEDNKSIYRIERMSGIEFERFMADFFRTKGYLSVKTTPRSGDHGVDLLLTTEDRKIVIQLKRQANPVGNQAVRDVYFGMMHYDADEAWVVTTSSFTPKAREAARKAGVKLHGGSQLRKWLRESYDE
jgi:restriction system protein